MNAKTILFILAFGMLVLTRVLSADAGEVKIVKDAKPEACIVIPENPTPVEKYAADELALYIRKITSASLRIVSKPPPGMPGIYIGPLGSKDMPFSEALKKTASGIREDGYAVEANAKGVFITAKHPRGLLYGVYHILRECGGVYWFQPGEIGEHCPKNSSFSVPDMLIEKSPVFGSRTVLLGGSPGWAPETFDWLLRNGMQMQFSNRQYGKDPDFFIRKSRASIGSEGGYFTYLMNGGTWNRAVFQKLFDAHPEYYGVYQGKKGLIDVAQPCTSNPDVVKRMTDTLVSKVASYGHDDVYAKPLNDDHRRWCECKNCQKLDPPEEVNGDRSGRHATRWWLLVNEWMKAVLDPEYPNRKFHVFLYQSFRLPPKGVKPVIRPGMVGIQCPHGRCYAHTLNDPACPNNVTRMPMFTEWYGTGLPLVTWEYISSMPGRSTYLPVEEAWIKDLKFYFKKGHYGYMLEGSAPDFDYKSTEYGRRHYYHLKNLWPSLWQLYWLTGHFSWNIDDDFSEVYEKASSLYYGAAWKYMKPYRELLKDAFRKLGVHMGYATNSVGIAQAYETPGLAEKAEALLAQAEKAVSDDPLRLKRVRLDMEYFKTNWSDSSIHNFNMKNAYNAKRAAGIIQLDGVLDEKDWENAEKVSDFHEYGSSRGLTPVNADPQTTASIVYDDKNIYFGCVAMKAKHRKTSDKAKANGDDAFQGSHFEIFVTPPSLNGKYIHLSITRNSFSYQALTSAGTDGQLFTRNQNAEIGLQYKVRDLPDRWILEARLSAPELAGGIRDGDIWKINIGRTALTDSDKEVFSSWAFGDSHDRDHHRPVVFGKNVQTLQNGSFETAAPITKEQNPDNLWKVKSPLFPSGWFLHPVGKNQETPEAELVEKEAPDGNRFLRLEGRYVSVKQTLQLKGKDSKKLFVSLKARGTGMICVKLNCGGKNYDSPALRKKVRPDQWQTFSGVIESPDSPHKTLLLQQGASKGYIEIDDVKAGTVENEVMPSSDRDR
ncbi:MAG: hypothetical protein BWY31_04269 [Lentisphaerae bacterium ADurb.Bin242]|nr:MAG: hypothetical protein BWY31_04269 [Lentisphaerae bacterium ADurb.Bin242]